MTFLRGINPWDRELAQYLLSHSLTDADPIRRAWFSWLSRGVRRWPSRREHRACADPHLACLEFLQKVDGEYCEGLYLDAGIEVPEVAIWALTSNRIICFSQGLGGPHSIHGCAISSSAIWLLRERAGVVGPYLFSSSQEVFDRCVLSECTSSRLKRSVQ